MRTPSITRDRAVEDELGTARRPDRTRRRHVRTRPVRIGVSMNRYDDLGDDHRHDRRQDELAERQLVAGDPSDHLIDRPVIEVQPVRAQPDPDEQECRRAADWPTNRDA